MVLFEKDEFINKLCKMLRDQENMISQIRYKLKFDGYGKVKIDALVNMPDKPEEDKVIKKLKAQITNIKFEIKHLTNDFNELKDMHERLTNDWSIAEHKIIDLEEEIKGLKLAHELKISCLNGEFNSKEKGFFSKIQELERHRVQHQKDFNDELKIKDEILNRYVKYSEALK